MEIELFKGARSFTAELAIDAETGEIGGEFPLDVLVQKNRIGTCAYILHTRAEVEMWKNRIKQLTATVKAFEANAERAKTALLHAMQVTGTKAIKSDDGLFKAVLYPERDESVDVFDTMQLPLDYMREIPTRFEPDKALIKQALKDGFDVPGAKLDKKDRLQIS